ncbi:MAG: Crp/Fnr family transcriptional regulator [Acidobacteriota bacterium]
MKNINVLKKFPLFSNLAEDELKSIMLLTSERDYPKGSIIIYQGDPGTTFYIILKGKVNIVLKGKRGKEIIIDTLSEGDFFGEMALFDDQTRSATVVAAENSKFLVLTRNTFLSHLKKHSEISIHLLKEMLRRLRKADEKIGDLALFNVHNRLIHFLLNLSKTSGISTKDGIIIKEVPSQQQITYSDESGH